jgi:phage terminase large subunit-like protein
MDYQDKPNYIREYIEEIESGRIIVSKKVKKVYLKWMKPIINDEHPLYYFNPNPGLKFIKFSETYCKQSKGEWSGKRIELMLWQKAWAQTLFGTLRRDTHHRRFTESFLVVARKNGKTTMNAPLTLFGILHEKGAEVYAAATVTSQAQRIIEEAIDMIKRERELDKIFSFRIAPPKSIKLKGSSSLAKVLSSNVQTFDGLNTSLGVIDEVHELKRQIYDILKQSTSARQQPIISMISTAGFVREGLYDNMYDHAVNILEGISPDDTLLPLIYEMDSIEEIADEAMWIKANPSLGVIKQIKYIQDQVQRAESDKNYMNTVLTKDFNIRGITGKGWLSFDDLNNEIVYTEEQLKKFDNSFVIGGLDLSRTGDLTSFTTMLFDKADMIEGKKPRAIAITMYWITAKFYNERIQDKNNKIPWAAWVERGLVRISGTELIEYRDIADYISNNFREKGWMYQYIQYDRYSAQYLISDLVSRGYQKDTCLVATAQGAKTLSIPMQLIEADLRQKVLCYQNNPITKWCLSNVQLEQDRNGNYMPKKINDQRERKIDGFATILNCYVRIADDIGYYLGPRRQEG